MTAWWLTTPYRDHGRDRTGFDCWGLVRAVLHEVFGGPLLPTHTEVIPTDGEAFTRAWNEDVGPTLMIVEKPQPGDLLGCYQGNLMVHVGICMLVDGRLKVLHTHQKGGPRLDSIERISRSFTHTAWFR